MKYGCIEVVDIVVFDEDMNEITRMDSLSESQIVLDESPFRIDVTDCLFNYDLFKHAGDNSTLLPTFKPNKRMRLEVYLTLRSDKTGDDHEFILQVPSCYVVSRFNLKLGKADGVWKPATFKWTFIIDDTELIRFAKVGEERKMLTKGERDTRISRLIEKLQQY